MHCIRERWVARGRFLGSDLCLARFDQENSSCGMPKPPLPEAILEEERSACPTKSRGHCVLDPRGGECLSTVCAAGPLSRSLAL